MRVKALVSVLAMLAVPALSLAAPNWYITSGGSNNAAVPAGPVSLQLVANLNTDGQPVSGWQISLKSSAPALFAYGTPAVTVNVPSLPAVASQNFTNNDIVFGGPVDGESLPGNENGEVSVFTFSGGDRAAFNGQAMLYNIVSKAPLAPGSYTFWMGDSGIGSFMANSQNPDGIAFGDPGIFTLRVTPEPTSALLLLAALPFLRRRQVA